MTERPGLPTRERLLGLIGAMAGRPVVMVVDLVADRFVTGSPKRISREAPVLILSYEGEQLVPGGGANAVANVAGLDGEPLVVGRVGNDASGRGLLDALGRLGVATGGVLVADGYRTPTKTRILAGGRHGIKQQVVRYDVEDRRPLKPEERRLFEATLAGWHGRATVAVLSDYGYGAVEPALLPALRELLGPGGRMLGDSRHRLTELRGLDGATPNEEEAEALLGRPLEESRRAALEAGRRLRERLDAGFVLITRGSLGMELCQADGGYRIPVHGTDQVADVTGAGDTVIGVMALALAAGATPLEAALLADYAGGVVVMKAGTATLGRGELRQAVESDPRPLEEVAWERW